MIASAHSIVGLLDEILGHLGAEFFEFVPPKTPNKGVICGGHQFVEVLPATHLDVRRVRHVLVVESVAVVLETVEGPLVGVGVLDGVHEQVMLLAVDLLFLVGLDDVVDEVA